MRKKFLSAVYCLLSVSCTALAQKASLYHAAYDDSTLAQQSPLTLMPFNRIIQSAGKVVTYGNPQLENHALDFTILPDSQHIAIEDRYGIAVLDIKTQQIVHRWTFSKSADRLIRGLMSTYSGIKSFSYNGHTYITWSAANTPASAIMMAEWDTSGIKNVSSIPINAVPPAEAALPNDIAVRFEEGVPYLYVVLNGNNQLMKIRFDAKRQVVWTVPTGVAPYGLRIIGSKIYVTNWAGPLVTDTSLEHAGTPWGSAYTNPATGGTARGSLFVIDATNGQLLKELPLGLHPNAIAGSPDGKYLYISNGNSDYISVVNVQAETVADSIPVGLFRGSITYYGSSPNALLVNEAGTTLYVANGLDNALCVVKLGANAATKGTGRSVVKGYIPTEAYPGGLALLRSRLYVANIEAKGSRVLSPAKDAYSVHQELGSISIIPVPSDKLLKAFTKKVRKQSISFRIALTNQPARKHIAPRPVPERIGEPSVFKHVVYIIKENKTYDQVYGDIQQGRGMPKLCIYGDSITPNQHKLVNAFSLMDNYYASGKSSAEGHQWADAAMVSDYIEKSVRAWFRSYPHRQDDAMVYNKNGFIWNNALDHGKTVRIYGEACLTNYDHSLKWIDIYNRRLNHEDQGFTNTTTIARIRPVISPAYPDCDNFVFTDQLRADIFIDDWKKAEQAGGDILPDLMVLSLPNDHTAGTSPDFPVPQAMVADNDLAVGRIIDAITHSRFWDSTVVFITEDDSQSGWDHISSYRTTGLVISPYSVMGGRAIHTNYNQTGMVRTIEQVLGIPPMNVIDATALPLFDCFTTQKSAYTYTCAPNIIPLNRMNKPIASLKGKAAYYARLSASRAFKDVDGGDDDLMNKILWFNAKGEEKYPEAPGKEPAEK
ncbi:MAG TPA: bifunctional YncE family protein/alkaline phosphatase family protein [Chitinophagaceae bacterium]|nr:bifunctional YncE family protein/alkaline phosphatase family protein [Chitinophagaceae bacterium]